MVGEQADAVFLRKRYGQDHQVETRGDDLISHYLQPKQPAFNIPIYNKDSLPWAYTSLG